MIRIRPAGDAALLLETAAGVGDADQEGNAAARLAAAIRAAALPGVLDVVPGAATVLVCYEPGSSSAEGLAARLRELAGAPTPALPAASTGELVLDTVYDGPDLAEVAALTGLAAAEVISRHSGARYRVGWLGFSPGFGYLTGLDRALASVPRRVSPRVAVPAGSVAIAGGLAAAYPAASPGGWRLLGRTDAVLWDPQRDPPALLSPGRRVRFRPVDRLPAGAHATSPARLSGPGPIQVLQPGPLTTVQDLGRPGLAHLGVPRGGAADAASLRLANALVGNPAGAAGLEVTLGRLAVRFDDAAVVAVTGAPVPLTLATGSGRAADGGRVGGPPLSGGGPGDGRGPADGRHPASPPAPAHGAAFAVPAGSVLRLGAPATGLRSYLAVAGGIDIEPELGSRSADRLSGLGPPPLRPGDRLPVGQPRSLSQERRDKRPGTAVRAATGHVLLRVIAGPRDDWFAPGALTTLAAGSYQVTAASDRTGLRLAGPSLARSASRPGELPSEGVAAGSLQVTHDGQPILLLADHPTTGGYPVIAVVVSADLGLAAQLRPGQHLQVAVSRVVLD